MRRRTFWAGALTAAAAAAAKGGSALTGNQPRADITKSQPDTVPYGTDRLQDTNTRELTQSIANQLASAGLRIPDLELFPENNVDVVDREIEKLNIEAASVGLMQLPPEGVMSVPLNNGLTRFLGLNNARAYVKGLPSESDGGQIIEKLFVADHSKGKVLDKACQCGKAHSLFEKDYPEFRVFAALHETSHYVDFQKGFSPKISRTEATNLTEAQERLVTANIRERIADASSTLYVLSNYKNGRDLINIVINWRNSSSEPSHYTASTIQAAVQLFDKNPRRGMSIVETSDMAANIVSRQPGIVSEVKSAAKTYWALKDGDADMASPGVKKAEVARRALFGLTPVG